jgi:hypothetical protein
MVTVDQILWYAVQITILSKKFMFHVILKSMLEHSEV